MKKLLFLSIFSFLVFANCEVGCEDEFEYKVSVYSWGTLNVRNSKSEDITSQFVGTKFKVVFFKNYCSGKVSAIRDYNYTSLSNGELRRNGTLSFNFTMRNIEDNIEFNVYAILPDNTEYKIIGPAIAENFYHWDENHHCRGQMTIVGFTNDGENIDWENSTAKIEFIL